MSEPHIHADCLELVTNLSEMTCSASISDGIVTLEDGTQIDLSGTAKHELEQIALKQEWDEEQEAKEGGDDGNSTDNSQRNT